MLQSSELMYSYAVITVDAHSQLSWMHDRMPVSSFMSPQLCTAEAGYLPVSSFMSPQVVCSGGRLLCLVLMSVLCQYGLLHTVGGVDESITHFLQRRHHMMTNIFYLCTYCV